MHESESGSVVSDSLRPHGTVQSMEFSRPEYWSAWPFPSPGCLPDPGMEPRSTTLQADSLPAEPPGKPKNTGVCSRSLLQQIFPTQGLNPGSCIAGRFFTSWAIRKGSFLSCLCVYFIILHSKVIFLEKGIATRSGILAWRIPWTEEPEGLPSMESHRVEHDQSDLAQPLTSYLS